MTEVDYTEFFRFLNYGILIVAGLALLYASFFFFRALGTYLYYRYIKSGDFTFVYNDNGVCREITINDKSKKCMTDQIHKQLEAYRQEECNVSQK